jgi:4-hydroxy-4-methyl-2-oxoglutarate aldolase
VLVGAAVRDVEELEEMGLPIWTRYVRSRGATKDVRGELDVPVVVGGCEIRPGDLLVLDADGVTCVAAERADEVLQASLAREAKEAAKRQKLQAGALSFDLDNLG